ncbi:MAG: hypothetical protein HYY94_03820 [Gemmatimonadetes bacterium]|nr:hypothetical protein [Gemmatimonadota bacterium]
MHDLIARAEGAVQISVEAKGAGVAEQLRALPGVRSVDQVLRGEGRVAVTLTADGSRDLRPHVFELAKSNGWTLYELHQQAGSLEALFRQLTTAAPEEGVPA